MEAKLVHTQVWHEDDKKTTKKLLNKNILEKFF
jgi:hypothetical protein